MSSGCCAKYERSNAFSFAKSGGFGNTPWVNANSSISEPITTSKISSTTKVAATAG